MSSSMFDPKYRAKSSSSKVNDFNECNRLNSFIEADKPMEDCDENCALPIGDWERVWKKKQDFREWRDHGGDTYRAGRKRR